MKYVPNKRERCYGKMENWNDASTSQGTPKIVRKPPEGRNRKERILLQTAERR